MTGYKLFRSMTTAITEPSAVDGVIEDGLDDHGPDEAYRVHAGPIIWQASDGTPQVTFVYRLTDRRS